MTWSCTWRKGLRNCCCEVEETTVGNTVTNDDFSLSIWADKSTYKTDEPIECYSSLTYLGQDDIKVYHADPLVVFYIEGGSFNGEWARQDSLNLTDFTANEEIVLPFQKSGGWSSDDPNAEFFKEFYSKDELILPAGDYKLWTQVEYSTDVDDIVGTMNTLEVSISVHVK